MTMPDAAIDRWCTYLVMRGHNVRCRGGCGAGPCALLTALSTAAVAAPQGCVCPVGAEKTCQGLSCPRRGVSQAGSPLTILERRATA